MSAKTLCLSLMLALAIWSLAQTDTKPVTPSRDFGRLLRVYSLGDRASGNIYKMSRKVGDRMFLSSEATSNIAEMRELAAVGINLVQSLTNPLSTPEVVQGGWNWTPLDAEQKAALNAGMDWSLFLTTAFPPSWYRASKSYTKMTSLKKQDVVDAFSPWSPEFYSFAEHTWKAVKKQYPVMPVIAVGIHGDYGEAGLLTGQRMKLNEQKEQWVRMFNNENNYLDFWCADDKAKQNLQQSIIKKYGTIEAVNNAWYTMYSKESDINFPFINQVSYRGRLDFVQWYKNSITDMTDKLTDIVGSEYTNTLCMFPIGLSDLSVKIGADVSGLFSMAAKKNVAVRYNNAGFYSYAKNHAVALGMIRAASQFYKTPVWAASAAPSDQLGFSQRLFEALSIGADGYFDWKQNWLKYSKNTSAYLKHLTRAEPIVEIACLFPSTQQDLRPDESFPSLFIQGCTELRDKADFDVLDERMVVEGALSGYKIAVLWEGTIWRRETLDKLKTWVSNGGILLAYDFGKFAPTDGDGVPFATLFGHASILSKYKPEPVFKPLAEWTRSLGKGYTIYFPAQKEHRLSFIELICKVAYSDFPAGTGVKIPFMLDNKKDGVFTTICDDRILLFNTTDEQKTMKMQLVGWSDVRDIQLKSASINVVYYSNPPEELRYECEGFTQLNQQPTIKSPWCSPGSGVSAVNVKAGAAISTNIQIETKGVYRIFARTTINGESTPVQLTVNSKNPTAKPIKNKLSDMVDYGLVSLNQGINVITMTHNKPFIADVVIITNDMNIAGYRFASN